MDTHVPFSTVREALLFSAGLRQPRLVPDAEEAQYVFFVPKAACLTGLML